MPKNLKRAVGDRIPPDSQYTCGQIAFLMQVAHRTAAKMIDRGIIKGFRMVSSKAVDRRERRVLHSSLIAFIEEYPDYHFMLDRLKNYDPAVDFGKDYRKRWDKKIRKKHKVRITEELGNPGLEYGLVLESSEPKMGSS